MIQESIILHEIYEDKVPRKVLSTPGTFSNFRPATRANGTPFRMNMDLAHRSGPAPTSLKEFSDAL